MRRTGRDEQQKHVDGLMMETDKDDGVEENRGGDESMDADMVSALASLRAFTMPPQKVPARVTFGHRGCDIRR